MNEHELNTCKLAPGDRVILTNEAIDQIKVQTDGIDLTDTIWHVAEVINPRQDIKIVEDRKTIAPREISVPRYALICEHETVNIHKYSTRGKGPSVQNLKREDTCIYKCTNCGAKRLDVNGLRVWTCAKCDRSYEVTELPHNRNMMHVSEPATYKEPTDIMVHASTEKGKGITHYCEQLGGDNTVKITEYMNKYNANERHMELLDLLLMLAYENNALKDELNKVKTVVRRLTLAEQERHSLGECPDPPDSEDEEDRTDEIEYNRVVREGLKHD